MADHTLRIVPHRWVMEINGESRYVLGVSIPEWNYYSPQLILTARDADEAETEAMFYLQDLMEKLAEKYNIPQEGVRYE